MTELDPRFVELATRNYELERDVARLRGDLRAAAVVIDLAYGILDQNGFEAIERAKAGLRAFIEDQIENGGYKVK